MTVFTTIEYLSEEKISWCKSHYSEHNRPIVTSSTGILVSRQPRLLHTLMYPVKWTQYCPLICSITITTKKVTQHLTVFWLLIMLLTFYWSKDKAWTRYLCKKFLCSSTRLHIMQSIVGIFDHAMPKGTQAKLNHGSVVQDLTRDNAVGIT